MRDSKCKYCGKEYDCSRSSGGRRTVCNSCTTNRFRSKRKLMAVAYKGGKCEKCGYSKCVRALTFHHLDPSKKTLTFGREVNVAWERVKKELDKCILVCANCHAEIEQEIDRSRSSCWWKAEQQTTSSKIELTPDERVIKV